MPMFLDNTIFLRLGTVWLRLDYYIHICLNATIKDRYTACHPSSVIIITEKYINYFKIMTKNMTLKENILTTQKCPIILMFKMLSRTQHWVYSDNRYQWPAKCTKAVFLLPSPYQKGGKTIHTLQHFKNEKGDMAGIFVCHTKDHQQNRSLHCAFISHCWKFYTVGLHSVIL